MSSESPRKLGQMLAAYFPEEDGSVTYVRFKNNEPGNCVPNSQLHDHGRVRKVPTRETSSKQLRKERI
ncbi:hypothetical protein TVAGG3_0639920, partial [Trichomonas vaginalis G3]|uniref:hypothetical protein n=1 Tax=Trichomonas vaginalis (strain ATCC PRA-98 / G3) TaxID=412133 RepID=UPI0021E53D6A